MITREFDYLYRQRTISSPIAFIGIGLHSGKRVTMRVLPAGPDEGISFVRRDLPSNENAFVARWNRVSDTEVCTSLGNLYGHHVATVEHLLSAFHALGIDNARVDLDGPEVPVMDGSAMPFANALTNAGMRSLETPRDVIVIRRPVRLQHGGSWVEFLPDDVPRITVSIDFAHQDIGNQSMTFCLSPTTYLREIAPARTFGFAEHLWHLRRRGLAQGSSVKNAILLKDGRVENLDGLRFADEFVRHKALDVVGDLALVGVPIIGHYRGHRSGHRLNNDLIRLLMNDTRAWQRTGAEDLFTATPHDVDRAVFGVSEAALQAPGDWDSSKQPADSPLLGAIHRIGRLFKDDGQ